MSDYDSNAKAALDYHGTLVEVAKERKSVAKYEKEKQRKKQKHIYGKCVETRGRGVQGSGK